MWVIATQAKPSHPGGPHRKKHPSLLEYSDNENEDDVGEEGPRAIGCDTELQLYIDSPKFNSVLRFWETKKTVLPRLYAISRKIFFAFQLPAPVLNGYFLTDKNFEDQIFTHRNADLLGAVCRNRKSAYF